MTMKIYTRTGDTGGTALFGGGRVSKDHPRVEAYGEVDETNSLVGAARQHTAGFSDLDRMLMRIQNDLFDLGADLATPDTGEVLQYEPLRIVKAQVERLENEIDALNADLSPLRSFVLPGGTAGAAALHVARTVARRAERRIVELDAIDGETVSPEAIAYINRLSDFLFVAARWINDKGAIDVLWVPGQNR